MSRRVDSSLEQVLERRFASVLAEAQTKAQAMGKGRVLQGANRTGGVRPSELSFSIMVSEVARGFREQSSLRRFAGFLCRKFVAEVLLPG